MRSFIGFLTFLVYLTMPAHGSPLQQDIEARADACTAESMVANIATIGNGVGKPLAFCDWYLTHDRTRSPIHGLSVKSLRSACVCLGASKPATKAVATTTMSPGAITTSCAAANVQLLKARFVDYNFFCAFYLAAPRSSSPLPALGPKGLWNACECALGLASTSTSSASTSTSIVSTSSSSTFSNTTATSTSTTSTALATSLTGYMYFTGIGDLGFSDSPSIGSYLQTSTSDLFTDEFAYVGSLTMNAYGYLVHMATNLCLTLIPAVDASSASGYVGGSIQLQTCATTATPPRSQSFQYNGYAQNGAQCFAADNQQCGPGYPTSSSATDVWLVANADCLWIQSASPVSKV